MSMLYDPLGLASCVTTKASVAMQDIWRCKEYNWDDLLPEKMVEHWKDLFRDIENLKTVQFPRCLKPHDALGALELHVFADASKMAYGAVTYLLWHTPGSPNVQIVSAKARVAPLQHTTIPRLKLIAALFASRLAKTVIDEKPSKVMDRCSDNSTLASYKILSP